EALESLKKAQTLAGELARRADGVLLDGETHELFAPQAWRLVRMVGWNGDLPAITSQIALRRNGGDDRAPRLVTFGMAKLGLPDIAAPEPPRSPGPPPSAPPPRPRQPLVAGQVSAGAGPTTPEVSPVRAATMKRPLVHAGAA